MRRPAGMLCSLAACLLLLVPAAFAPRNASAQASGTLPLMISEVSPGSVRVGKRTVVTVKAVFASTPLKLKRPVLQRVDADGNVLGTLGKFKKKGKTLVAKVRLTEAEPGVIRLRVDAGPRGAVVPASEAFPLQVSGDPSRLLELLALVPHAPQPPGAHALSPVPLPSDLSATLEAELKAVFGPDADLDLVISPSVSGGPSPAQVRPAADDIWVSAVQPNAQLEAAMVGVLNGLDALGFDTSRLRRAREEARFNIDSDVGFGFLLPRGHPQNPAQVLGLTVRRPANLNVYAATPYKDVLGRPVNLIAARYNRILLRADQANQVFTLPLVNTAKLRLTEGHSTLLHELLHVLCHEGGWDSEDDASEAFIHDLEECLNLLVTITLKRRNSQPFAQEQHEYYCRLTAALKHYPRGEGMVRALGWELPPRGQELRVDPPVLDFAVIEGETEAPAPKEISVTARDPETGVLSRICFRATVKKRDGFLKKPVTPPDYDIHDELFYFAPRQIGLTVDPLYVDETQTVVPRPRGCYEDELEISSENAAKPVTVKVRLTVVPRYSVSELPLPAGGIPTGMNAQGQVSGVGIQNVGGQTAVQGFIWSRSTGTVWLEPGSRADGINDGGTVFGTALFEQEDKSLKRQACTWSGGPPARLLPGPADPHSLIEARGINNLGAIVGRIPVGDTFVTRAALWQGGGPADLGTLGDSSSSSRASGINNLGVIVGTSQVSGSPRAFIRLNGKLVDLGTHPDLPGFNASATGVSDDGLVIGILFNTGAGSIYAFAWKDANQNGASDLGEMQLILPRLAFTTADAVNGSGWLIGSMLKSEGNFAPYISCGATGVDLNTLIPAGSGWVLQHAYAINPGGEIVGLGALNGSRAVFLLVPQPPPGQ